MVETKVGQGGKVTRTEHQSHQILEVKLFSLISHIRKLKTGIKSLIPKIRGQLRTVSSDSTCGQT